ncbi:MAG: hypothetical protein HZA04_04405 [Nitrospinae bacterium]|nr:hypothetical protein [Nitrospinota bacterium]
MAESYNPTDPIEIAPGVFHLGVQDRPNSFNNIPYLIVDGNDAVLIDPGSAKKEFFDVVLGKLQKALNGDLKKIKHIIVQHQDPDLCAAIPLVEPYCSPDLTVHAPLESKVLVQHYGFKAKLHPLDDGDTLVFGNNHTFVFAMTPYCHFIGSMVTYDVNRKIVFSSDAFGGFTGMTDLYAGPDYPIQLTSFLGQYLGSKRALEYALKRLEQVAEKYGIDMICPQHGCVIKKEQIPTYLEAAHNLHVGGEVDALAAKHGIKLEGE